MGEQKYYYRAEPSGVTEFSCDLVPEPPQLLCIHAIPVERETAKSVFLNDYGRTRRVQKDWIKQYASASIDEAVIAFYKRKESQIRILTEQLEKAKRDLKAVRPPEITIYRQQIYSTGA